MIDKMRLLSGDPIPSPNNKFQVHPLTLRQIKDMGEVNYNLYKNILLIERNSLKDLPGEMLEGKSMYQIFLELVTNSYELFLRATTALLVFTLESFDVINGQLFIIKDIGDETEQIPFTENDFEFLRHVLRIQNYIGDNTGNMFNPANDKARELRERLLKARAEVRKKQKKDDGVELSSIVSIVSNYVDGINPFNVWDLTIYTLYDSFMRLQYWDNYHTLKNLQPHVADDISKDIKHWAINIDPNTIKEDK